MAWRSGLAAFAAALWLPAAAQAQTEVPAQPLTAPATAPEFPEVAPEFDAVAKAGGRLASTGDADEDATLAAMNDVTTRGYASLGEHVPALRQVLANMPRPFTREHVEDGQVVYRGDSMLDCVTFATTLAQRDPAQHKFICRGNPYPAAAFYLGSYLNEVGRYDEALAALDQGLEAGPNAPALYSERDAALMALRRWEDAGVSAQKGLEIPNLAPADRARLLRNLGYALTELQRLDEAQAAYEDSLRLDPGNALAQHELTYIAALKTGAAPTAPGQLFRPAAKPLP